MTSVGYTLSSEEHAPADLVANARRAEELGFDFLTVSDHFHPWVEAQGHSPFVWAVLGAVATHTERVGIAVGVTCPMVRIHPVLVAQAAATTSLLSGGRFSLGLGSGEALNEHIFGDRWPTPEVRLEMLEEAVEVIRRMWTGETVDHRGRHYTVENARLFDPPAADLPIIVSGFGPEAVELAGRIGDGLWSQASEELVGRFEQSGGTGPRYAQLNVCVGDDEAACRRTVHEIWPNGAVPGQLSQDLPTFTHFEQAAELVDVETATDGLVHGPDVEGLVRQAKEYLDNGFDHVHFHQIGPDQDAFLDVWEREGRDALAGVPA